jgi:hypothetical protein
VNLFVNTSDNIRWKGGDFDKHPFVSVTHNYNIKNHMEVFIMYQLYYVNNDQTKNPGLHHEVHTGSHATELKIKNTRFIGIFDNEQDAVRKACEHYLDADGCAICCPKAHHG